MLVGGSKPNLAPHPKDKRSAQKSGQPDGSVKDLLDTLARISREHSIDWELMHDYGPIGFIRRGTIAPQTLPQIEALADIKERPEVYSRETDELIKKIRRLCSCREMGQWWEREIEPTGDAELVTRKARARYEELLRRARENGWEIQ